MKKVLIIFGGNSSEHEISCKSAQSIINNINKKLFNVSICAISKDNKWYEYDDYKNVNKNWLKNKKIKEINNIIKYLKSFDIIFPIIHGTNGEDGRLQGMLDLFNIKYVGSKTLASSVGMDKEASKILFEHLNINQVPYFIISKDYNIKEIKDKIDFPVIVKPANGGSSIGIMFADNEKILKKAIKEASKYDKKIIIEKYIKAKEIEVAVLQDKNKLIISNVGEIVSCNNFYDYKAKYEKESTLLIPADLDENMQTKIKELAKKIFLGIGASDFARIDFFLENDNIYINEINTIPGFTEISMFPKLIDNSGINYEKLITTLINNYF